MAIFNSFLYVYQRVQCTSVSMVSECPESLFLGSCRVFLHLFLGMGQKVKDPYKVVPPSDVSWFINPINYIVISTINHSYWSCKPT